MGQTKRLNFDISPEQEDELNRLRSDLGTSTAKDTVLRAVRVLSILSREARRGGRLYLQTRSGETQRLILPELEDLGLRWTWLVRRPHPWRRTPHIKGHRILASTVWRTMLANEMSPQEAADDLGLPGAAVEEAVAWCEANAELVEMEVLEERRPAGGDGSPIGA